MPHYMVEIQETYRYNLEAESPEEALARIQAKHELARHSEEPPQPWVSEERVLMRSPTRPKEKKR